LTAHSTQAPAAFSVLTKPVPLKLRWFESTVPPDRAAFSASYRTGGGGATALYARIFVSRR
jgi:hypothetical protein